MIAQTRRDEEKNAVRKTISKDLIAESKQRVPWTTARRSTQLPPQSPALRSGLQFESSDSSGAVEFL